MPFHFETKTNNSQSFYLIKYVLIYIYLNNSELLDIKKRQAIEMA